jgi:Ras-related protein Rab-2A
MSLDSSINFDYLLKYIIIGDAAVGKSNLLLRYAHGQFKPEYQLTIGVEFGAKNVNIRNKIYRVQIWDTAGQENFRSITRAYYKNSVCALVVYDISSRDSFNNVSTWIEDCKNQSPKTIFMVLVGNKSDLEDRRQVSTEEGQELADKYGILFYETSAKDGTNVSEIFQDSAEKIAKNIEQGYYDLENENCGIKQGVNRPGKNETNINLGNNNSNNNGRKNGCC